MDTFDYQRSSVPARMPSQRVTSLAAHRFEANDAENMPSPLSIRSVFRAARRYWWLILALWTVGSAGLGAAVYLKVKPSYRAASWLKVDPTVLDLYGGTTTEGLEPYMQTHVALIRSPNVLEAAAQNEAVRAYPRFRVAGVNPVQELSKLIIVGIQPGTHIIEVSMISNSPDEPATLVNAVVDAFLVANNDWAGGATKSQIRKLTTYKARLEADITRTTNELRARYARGNTVERLIPLSARDGEGNDKDGKTDTNRNWMNMTVANYHEMLAKSSNIKMELITAEADLEEAKRVRDEATNEAAVVGGDTSKPSPQIEARLRNDPELVELKSSQQTAVNRARRLRDNSRLGGDPGERTANEAVASLARKIQAVKDRKRLQFQDEMNANANIGNPETEVRRLELLVKSLIVKRRALDDELGKTKLENTKQQSDELEIRFLEEERHSWMAMDEVVARKREQLEFEAEAEERIRQVNKAKIDTQAISDKRMQYLAIAPIGVLGAVLGLVILLEIRSGRVGDPEILSARMRHEVFPIAPLPGPSAAAIGSDSAEKAEQRLARFVQSLDHLRVALCEGGAHGEGRCVMITSASGGEGKTTLSAHLAARCANAGTSTLLIDADLRRASLGQLLDVPAGPGLGDVLAGNAELESAVVTIQAGGFHFMSAGTTGIDPTRVLKSNRLAELIGQLRQMYDLVIIDTPPVLPVPDALIIGRWADGAVMAARYDASRLPMIERANRQIIAAGIPVLGVVVNGVKGQGQAYDHYGYNYNRPSRQEPSSETAGVS